MTRLFLYDRLKSKIKEKPSLYRLAVKVILFQRGLFRKKNIDKSAKTISPYVKFSTAYRLRKFETAAKSIDVSDFDGCSVRQRLAIIKCFYSSTKGVLCDDLLKSLVLDISLEKMSCDYDDFFAVYDEVNRHLTEDPSVIRICEEVVDERRRASSDRRWKDLYNWVKYTATPDNEKAHFIDELITCDALQGFSTRVFIKFYGAMKNLGFDQFCEKALRGKFDRLTDFDFRLLKLVLVSSPDSVDSHFINKYRHEIISDVSFLIPLKELKLQSGLFADLYSEIIERINKTFMSNSVFEKDKVFRVLLKVEEQELARHLCLSLDFKDKFNLLSTLAIQGFLKFEADDFHSARDCFVSVLREDPGDPYAASGLRLVTPRIDGNFDFIRTLRNQIGYGVGSQGRTGVRNVGSELVISELMSGRYTQGLYLKRNAAHWRKMKQVYGEKFLNYELVPLNRKDCSIFIIGDEGVGDEIRTAQFYETLSKSFRKVVISCDPRLKDIFSSSFPNITFLPVSRYRKGVSNDQILGDDRFRGIDKKIEHYLTEECRSYLESSDYVTFGQNLFFNNFTGNLDGVKKGAYLLNGDVFAVDHNGPYEKRRVGLLWRSHFKSQMRSYMYLDIDDLRPLIGAKNVDFHSIQHCMDDFEYDFCQSNDIKVNNEIDFFNDFDALADYLRTLDVVIGISSVPAELAAALGVNVWMLGFSPENYFLRTKGGQIRADVYTANSTIVAPDYINFSESRDDCVSLVMNEARLMLDQEYSNK